MPSTVFEHGNAAVFLEAQAALLPDTMGVDRFKTSNIRMMPGSDRHGRYMGVWKASRGPHVDEVLSV